MENQISIRRASALLVSALCTTVSPALASEPVNEAPASFPTIEQPAAESESGWTYDPGKGLTYSSADGDKTVKFGGRIMNDWVFQSADEGTKDIDPDNRFYDGTEFRRARIEVSGTLYEAVSFKASYDFAGGDADFKDVWIGIHDIVGSTDVKVGQFKEPFSLEELTSSKYITFMERALPVGLAPSRNTGGMLHDHYDGSKATWALGVFRDTDAYGDSTQEKDGAYNVTSRVTWAPVHNDDASSVVHLGLAGSWRRPESGDARVRTRPENHMAPYVLDTRNGGSDLMTDQITNYGAEVAWVGGPWSVQAEYIAQSISGVGGAEDVDTTGYYAFVSWFVTGEHRTYKAKNGAFGRVKPNKNYGKDGAGAWELALRYSNLDIDAPAAVSPLAGNLNDITLGANWYLNPNTRIMFNYVMGDLDSNTDAYDGNITAFMMRFQVDF